MKQLYYRIIIITFDYVVEAEADMKDVVGDEEWK